jgi:hypothetical protein
MKDYLVFDHPLRIRLDGSEAVLELTAGDTFTQRRVPRTMLDDAARGADAVLRAVVQDQLLAGIGPYPADDAQIERVSLSVAERSWAQIAWEAFSPGIAVVRTTAVRARVLQIPFSFPMRVLEAGDGPPIVRPVLDQIFWRSSREVAIVRQLSREVAIVDAFTSPSDVETFPVRDDWPTVEVLHLRNAELGARWLQQFTDRFQTRLVVAQCETVLLPGAREVAQTLVDRGGPAVWLFDSSFTDWQNFYAYIVHDRPLDWMQTRLRAGALFAGGGREDAVRYSHLAVELGKEEIRKVITDAVAEPFHVEAASAHGVGGYFDDLPPRTVIRPRDIVREAVDSSLATLGITPGSWVDGSKRHRLHATISKHLIDSGRIAPQIEEIIDRQLGDIGIIEAYGNAVTIDRDNLTSEIDGNASYLRTVDEATGKLYLTSKLDGIATIAPGLKFEEHESEGMLPLAAKVAEARALLRALGGSPSHAPRPPRSVNSAFYTAAADTTLVQIPQPAARLHAGHLLHFGVQIGDEDEQIVSLGSTALLEEVFRSHNGTWIEIGVTAIDFDLEGDPVQRLFLPAYHPTDLVTFAVRARTSTAVPGIARLRFTLYHENNIVQSFLVAAVLAGADVADFPAALATGLNAAADEVRALGPLGYLTRLEYSVVAAIGDSSTVEPRALSIVANDIAGEKVVTFKEEELFSVTIDPNLKGHVEAAREALNRASIDDTKLYRYLPMNAGTPEDLCDVLWDIADKGWQIYNTLVRGEKDQKTVRDRLEKGGGVHAAHVDASTTIPWSLLYDREVYDRKKKAVDGVLHDVTRAVCPASMPKMSDDGAMPKVECGGPGCLLEPAENLRRLAANDKLVFPETVICPRRFWGFMFPVDVPAQQVGGLNRTQTRAMPKTIAAGKPVNIVVGFNPNLGFGGKHQEDLDKIAKNRAVLLPPAYPGRDGIRDLLDDKANDADIIYFFCHALASLKTKGPSLDFGHGYDQQVEDDVLEAGNFHGKEWDHTPLVFMNGCGNIGFTPYAPSEFVKEFIGGRKAAAVIGTEVTVWELLATDFANEFFARFLDRKTTAGEALLAARRVLLAKNNPLGLVYTLYGSARLTIGEAAPG